MKLLQLLRADPTAATVAKALSSPRSFTSTSSASDDDSGSCASSSFPASTTSSPSRYNDSPPRSPWSHHHHLPGLGDTDSNASGLIASLLKQDGGKIYSLAAAGDALYTGTDSETVRVWQDRRVLSGFRTGSCFVKAIVVSADGRVFTGHQDGKIRVWRADEADPTQHRRVGSLPAPGWDTLASSVVNSSRVRGRRHVRRSRHADAVSCLSLDEPAGLLYSGSWDRSIKVWRLSDYRCLESLRAHDDAVNTVAAAGFDGLVFSGSADGTVKVWRRQDSAEGDNKTRHVLDRVLQQGEGAVTAVAVCTEARVVYVGSSDGLVTCWRWVVNGGEPMFIGVLAGHRKGTAVMCLAVSGTVVVSGSADGTLCMWRRDGFDHFKVAVLAGHTGPVKCVAVADDDDVNDEGRFVVYSGSLDGSVKVWRLLNGHDSAYSTSPAAQQSPVPPSPAPKGPRAWEPLPTLPSSMMQPPWAHQHVAAA